MLDTDNVSQIKVCLNHLQRSLYIADESLQVVGVGAFVTLAAKISLIYEWGLCLKNLLRYQEHLEPLSCQSEIHKIADLSISVASSTPDKTIATISTLNLLVMEVLEKINPASIIDHNVMLR